MAAIKGTRRKRASWMLAVSILALGSMSGLAAVAQGGETATAVCYVQTDGTLKVLALSFGAGYLSAPQVTLTNVPTGATATVVADAPVDGEIRSYTVRQSAGWPQTISFGQICPALVAVDGPGNAAPADAASRSAAPVRAEASFQAMNAPAPSSSRTTLSVDAYGAVGDGTTDDRKAIQAAFDAAGAVAMKSPGSNPTVSFTAGKTYFVGSTGGYYWGAFDDGSVPVAAELQCRARGGVVTGCSLRSHGENLMQGRTPIVFPQSVSGHGALIHYDLAACAKGICPHGMGMYVEAASGAGGAGYPDAFSVYVGPTCDGVPCQFLPPEKPALIGYGVRLPNNVTIEGNGATVTGGFKGAAASAAEFGNEYPYIATFANMHGGNDLLRDLTMMNVFIGIGNLGAFMNIENVGIGGGLAIQGQQSQLVNIHNLNYNCNMCALDSGIVVGGQWGTRAPATGTEGGEIANSLNIADSLHVDSFIFLQRYPTSVNQKALDCWYDRNFFHLEDQGITNSLNCYTPPGGIRRMPDQDLAGQQEPDDLWRGIFGIPVALYTRYGRQTNTPVIENLQAKFNLSYLVVAGPHIVGGVIRNAGMEGSGYCLGHQVYGSAACPNPYEPFARQPLGVVLTDSKMALDRVGILAPYQATLTYPWQLAPSIGRGLAYTGRVVGNGGLTDAESVPGNGGREWEPQFSWMYGGRRSNEDSASAQFEGERFGLHPSLDTWEVRVHDLFQPDSYPALLDIHALQGDEDTGRAYVKMSGLAVDSSEVQNGQVTGLRITDPGAGYPAYAQVGCAMAASSNAAVNVDGAGTPFQATCYGTTDAAGRLARLYLSAQGLGYLSAPPVTLDAPPGGGRQAQAVATIARMQSFLPVGHMVIDSFYLPSDGVVEPGTSVTLSNLPCPDANGIATAAPAMQDHVTVISMGSQNWGGPGLLVTAPATGSGRCSVTLNNPTPAAMRYGAGTARQPWELLIVGAASGAEQAAGLGPQGIPATQVMTKATASMAGGGSLSAATAVIGSPRLAAGCAAMGQLRVAGAAPKMACVMSGEAGNPAGVMPQCAVTAPDTVEIELCVAAPTPVRMQRYQVRVLP